MRAIRCRRRETRRTGLAIVSRVDAALIDLVVGYLIVVIVKLIEFGNFLRENSADAIAELGEQAY